MRLRRYAVTVMDNWTPMRTFWTWSGARRFYYEHHASANFYEWHGGEWHWMCGARDLGLSELQPLDDRKASMP